MNHTNVICFGCSSPLDNPFHLVGPCVAAMLSFKAADGAVRASEGKAEAPRPSVLR